MAINHNNSSFGNSSVFRGLYHNANSNAQSNGNSGSSQFHNQLFQNHLQQHNQSQSFNLAGSSNIQSSLNNSSSNHQFTPATSSVTLPAPIPVRSKSGISTKTQELAKPSNVPIYGNSTGNPDQMLTLIAKYWFDHNLESSLSSLEKDEHEKRIRDLRKQLENITETNWKYSSVDNYIGQT